MGSARAAENAAGEVTEEAIQAVLSDEEFERRNAKIESVRWLYTQRMSAAGYEWLGLPKEFHKDLGGSEDWEQIPLDDLQVVYDRELGDAFFREQLNPIFDSFDEVEQQFAVAAEAGGHADRYELVTVLLTIAMFFGGIAQVFKSVVRWPLLVVGAGTFAWSAIQLVGLPIAG